MNLAISPEQLQRLNPAEREELAGLLEQRELLASRRHYYTLYPEVGRLSRFNYPKHMRFFEAGAKHRERAFMGANRIGKTEGVLCYEVNAHLTGLYPKWWKGRRFDFPIEAWLAGKTNETTRDILQQKMFGRIAYEDSAKRISGTGMVPYDAIGAVTWKSHDLIDQVTVRHYDRTGEPDGWSILGMKSYQQGRGSFEGTAKHVIGLDEEPEGDEGASIYAECLTRTMTTDGLVLLSFTPLEGLSKVVMMFMPSGKMPEDGVVRVVDHKESE